MCLSPHALSRCLLSPLLPGWQPQAVWVYDKVQWPGSRTGVRATHAVLAGNTDICSNCSNAHTNWRALLYSRPLLYCKKILCTLKEPSQTRSCSSVSKCSDRQNVETLLIFIEEDANFLCLVNHMVVSQTVCSSPIVIILSILCCFFLVSGAAQLDRPCFPRSHAMPLPRGSVSHVWPLLKELASCTHGKIWRQHSQCSLQS